MLFALSNKNYFDNKNIFAIDLSENRINLVKKINAKINAFTDSAEDLKTIKDRSIDFLVATQVIEHVDDKKMINEIYRVLRDNGVAFISTVYKKWYGWYFYRCCGKWTLDPTHLREYTDTSQLLDIIKKYNFEILENEKTLHWFPITDFIFKRIGFKRNIYDNKIIKLFRNVKIPILGYYNWELVFKKVNEQFN